MLVTLLVASKVMLVRLVQLLKAPAPILVTLLGIVTLVRPLLEKDQSLQSPPMLVTPSCMVTAPVKLDGMKTMAVLLYNMRSRELYTVLAASTLTVIAPEKVLFPMLVTDSGF